MRALAGFAVAVVATGCGGLSYEVDRDLLHDVSVENKLVLFEAENEVSIALDEQELLQRQIRDARDQILEIKAMQAETENDEDRAKARKDEKAAALAVASRQVLGLKRAFLDSRVKALRERLGAQGALVRVAFGKYELAKARLVKKNNVRGADEVDLVDFEHQVDKLVVKAREAQADVEDADKVAKTKRDEWLAARNQLEAQSGGGAASPWAEDATAWGNP